LTGTQYQTGKHVRRLWLQTDQYALPPQLSVYYVKLEQSESKTARIHFPDEIVARTEARRELYSEVIGESNGLTVKLSALLELTIALPF
jgi:hypothetical protein